VRTSQIIASYNSDYRNADLGYEEYRAHAPISRGAGYRDGFKNGYEDGYKNRPMRSDVYGLHDNYDPDRVPRNDEDVSYYANWSYSDVAFDTGYRDGLSAGRSDFSQGKDYRPEKHDCYEDGDLGYRKSFGPGHSSAWDSFFCSM